MTMNMEQVISKVEKLLALGTSSNEHEAALAVAKAQDLMAAYGLQMEQVTGRKADRQDVKETAAFNVFERGKTTAWRQDVLEAVSKTSGVWIARGYHTEHIKSKHAKYGARYATYRTAYFIGLPGDVELAGYAYSFLVGEIERLAQEHAGIHWAAIRTRAKENGITVHAAEQHYATWYTHPLKAKASFTKGAAEGVISMLNAEQRRRRQDSATNALVINREQIIRDYWYMKQYGKTYDQWRADLEARMAKDHNPNAVSKPMTPAQVRRLVEQNARRAARDQRRQEAEERRKWANIDYRSYSAGVEAGRSMTIRPGVHGGTAGPVAGQIKEG